MSDEESDADLRRPSYRLSVPMWRSSELTLFLHELDREAGHSQRQIATRINQSAVVPYKLPVNCYSEEWMSRFPRIKALRECMKNPVELSVVM
jgi:hypothetical protein